MSRSGPRCWRSAKSIAAAGKPSRGNAERGARCAADHDASQYVGFEDRFRGSEADIRSRLADYVSYFAGQSNVLDVGCGRGEFLDLLQSRHLGEGARLNPEMVEVCRSRGLDATAGDARAYLQGLPDESLGGLIAVQVIEHLEPPI